MTKSLGARIIEKRKSLKASAVVIAEVLGVSVASFYKWEKGTKPSDFEDSKKIEKFLESGYDSLIVTKIAERKAGIFPVKSEEQGLNYSESYESYLLREKLIKSLQEQIDLQKNLIDSLQAQLNLYNPDVGKTGARRHSA